MSKTATAWPTPKGTDGERGGRGDLLAMARGYQMAHNGTLPDASNQLTLFAEAFPVSLIVSPADAAPPPTTATSGRSSPDLFASCDPDGSWRKTYPDCSPVRLDGSSVPFSETWPRAGMTVNGRAYQLAPLVRLTDVTASGLWPTPSANEDAAGTVNGNMQFMLTHAAKLWPTPCAADAKNVPYQKGDHGVRYPMLLGAVAPERMWPTPKSSVSGPDYARREREGSGADDLATAIGGQLNPDWVSVLMGYPPDWTEVE